MVTPIGSPQRSTAHKVRELVPRSRGPERRSAEKRRSSIPCQGCSQAVMIAQAVKGPIMPKVLCSWPARRSFATPAIAPRRKSTSTSRRGRGAPPQASQQGQHGRPELQCRVLLGRLRTGDKLPRGFDQLPNRPRIAVGVADLCRANQGIEPPLVLLPHQMRRPGQERHGPQDQQSHDESPRDLTRPAGREQKGRRQGPDLICTAIASKNDALHQCRFYRESSSGDGGKDQRIDLQRPEVRNVVSSSRSR